MPRHMEYQLQKAVCLYLNLNYPKVLFLSDTVANIKLTMPQAARNKAIQKAGFKCPDLIILEPNRKHKGLFIELKIESPFKKDGKLKKNDHLEGQERTIKALVQRGYAACFATGFEEAKEKIDQYMKAR